MYVAINKLSGEVAVIKEKSPLAEHISMPIRTLYRKAGERIFENDSHIVYKVDVLKIKSERGGTGFKK